MSRWLVGSSSTSRFGGSNSISAITAPTTGQGDVNVATALINPIGGAQTVDSDAANRVLAVTGTMSVSNAANQILVEGALLEIIG